MGKASGATGWRRRCAWWRKARWIISRWTTWPRSPCRSCKSRSRPTRCSALGANNRTTQLFFNMKDNKDLDKQGFAPLGKVITGMDVVERLYSAYGDMAPRGQGPDPSKIEVQGNTYLDAKFPRLDYIKKAAIQ